MLPESLRFKHHHCTSPSKAYTASIRKNFQIWEGGLQGLQMFSLHLCFEGENQENEWNSRESWTMEGTSERIGKIDKAVFHLSTPFCCYFMYLSATLIIHVFKAENQLPLMSGYRNQLGINPNRGRSLSRSRTQFQPRVVKCYNYTDWWVQWARSKRASRTALIRHSTHRRNEKQTGFPA